MRSLYDMGPRQLEALFRASSAKGIPRGRTRGSALIATGTPLARIFARTVRAFAWKGKTFAADGRSLANRVTPLDLSAVRAQVYVAESLSDGAPCIVIDYSRTSLVARFIRDEIREVDPDIYLGKAYVLGLPVLFFALETSKRSGNS